MEKLNNKTEPLFHITRRLNITPKQMIGWRVAAIILSMLIVGIIVVSSASKGNGFFGVYGSMFSGVFGTERRIWIYLRDVALLLGVSLALVPAFKMKYWNLGGNGQILMGCLGATIVLYYWGGKIADPLSWLLMIVFGVLFAAIWAVIPAIFKAFFNTNESLFTLMLNYIAAILVGFFISYWYPKGTGTMSPIDDGAFPTFGTNQFGKSILPIVIIVVLTVILYFYLNFSKHGYELTVVGESENTAKYIGINVKRVVIRTVILSGAICGLVGVLLTGAINHTMSTSMDNNMGFTGIMVAWLSNFSVPMMVLCSAFIIFLTNGMTQVNVDYGFSSKELASVATGIVYFLIIASAFFVNYKITFRSDIQEKIDAFNAKVNNAFANVFKKIKSIFKKGATK